MLTTLLRQISARLKGGTAGFNAAERTILAAVAEHLPDGERSAFAAQVEGVHLVQRQHPGRLVVAFYPRATQVQALPYSGYEYCLAKVQYKSVGGQRKTTSVVLHNGRLMSLESNVPQSEGDISEVSAVKLHPKGYRAEATAMDAEEHGRAD